MINITIEKTSDKPLYVQIRDALQTAIREGTLLPGDKIPPVTALAKEIGVTHATIRRALEDLSKAGYIVSHVGRGTFVTTRKHCLSRTSAAKPPPEEDCASNQRTRGQSSLPDDYAWGLPKV